LQAFNILRYAIGERYLPHHDVFQEAQYGKQSSNRIATMITYLDAPDEGGETIFPAEGRSGFSKMANLDYNKCDQGYRYKPRKGDALLFWSLNPDGSFDDRSLHGACPVISGTKWVATKWMRDKPRR
jgi:prolyl 4-hydroxylase